MLEAVVFDLDGTLIDSAPDLHAAAARMLCDLKRPTLSIGEVASFIGNGVERLVERCLDASGGLGNDAKTAVLLFSKYYSLAPARLSQLRPGVHAALAELQAHGIRLGVCTNKPQALAAAILRQFDLLPPVSVVVGGDNQRALKPDPAPLHYCIGQLCASPQTTLYVGDSEVDEEAAARAALPFALFSGGYRRKSAEDMCTAFVFNRYVELARWVLSGRDTSP